MIASKGGAQLSIDGLELRTDQHATHRESVGNTLGHSDDIRLDAQPLMGEKLSAAAVATLNLIADQHGSVLLTSGGQTLCKLWGCHLDATHTLDAL